MLLFVFNFDLFQFSAAILEKGLLLLRILTLHIIMSVVNRIVSTSYASCLCLQTKDFSRECKAG